MGFLTNRTAETSPDHAQPRLRGRTYAVPFEEVWQATLSLLQRRRRWQVTHVDDQEGVLRVEIPTLLGRSVRDFEIRITLDQDAQTRVDLSSASRKGLTDLGSNARRIARFLRKLDRVLLRNRKQRAAAQRAA